MIFFVLLLGGPASLAQYFLTLGYGIAPMARISPFTYTTVFFASILGFVFWNEVLHPVTWIGASLIITGGILASVSSKGRSCSISLPA